MKWRSARNPTIILQVAPVRERGLKCCAIGARRDMGSRRSREGAWIEIACVIRTATSTSCRSREGAWIEIVKSDDSDPRLKVAPVRERGLKYYYVPQQQPR